jgi:hypothetical protein
MIRKLPSEKANHAPPKSSGLSGFGRKAVERLFRIKQSEMKKLRFISFFPNKGLIDTQKWGGWYPNIMNDHPIKYILLKK